MRSAEIARKTEETDVRIVLELDEPSSARRTELDLPDGFLAHMIEALARHAGWSLEASASGDTHVDLHHTVEDLGLCLGEALDQALGTRRGVERFADAYAPLDEALARCVVDLSGRGFFSWQAPDELAHAWVTQTFPLTLVADFFQAFADRSRSTIHLDVVRGRNPHHVAEACFKATALALRRAVELRPGEDRVPSTKGTLV